MSKKIIPRRSGKGKGISEKRGRCKGKVSPRKQAKEKERERRLRKARNQQKNLPLPLRRSSLEPLFLEISGKLKLGWERYNSEADCPLPQETFSLYLCYVTIRFYGFGSPLQLIRFLRSYPAWRTRLGFREPFTLEQVELKKFLKGEFKASVLNEFFARSIDPFPEEKSKEKYEPLQEKDYIDAVRFIRIFKRDFSSYLRGLDKWDEKDHIRGPKFRYPTKSIILSQVFKWVVGIDGDEILIRHLESKPELRQALCCQDIPPQHVISRRMGRYGLEKLLELFQRLARVLFTRGILPGTHQAVDSMLLESGCDKRKKDKTDPDARWSRKKYGGRIFGYKLHLVVCAHTQLPLAVCISSANEADSVWCIPLLMQVMACVTRDTKYLLADKGYDSIDIFEFFNTLHRRGAVIIGKNPRRSGSKTTTTDRLCRVKRGSRRHKKLYRMRSSVERENKILKHDCRLNRNRKRDLLRFSISALLAGIAILVIALVANLLRRPDLQLKKSFVLF